MRILTAHIGLLPEICHRRVAVIAAHSPHGVGVRASEKNVWSLCLQRQNAVVLKKHNRLRSNVIGSLALFRCVEFDIFLAIQISIFVEHSEAELMFEHILHRALKSLWLYKSLLHSLRQKGIVGTMREIHVVAGIDGCSCTMHIILHVWNLVDCRIVAYNNAVEAYIATKNIGKNLCIGHAVYAMHRMITRHHHTVLCEAYHCFVRQKDFFHHLFLFCLTTSAIAEVVLGTSAHAFLQSAFLQTFDEGCAENCGKIGILAV